MPTVLNLEQWIDVISTSRKGGSVIVGEGKGVNEGGRAKGDK